MSEKTEEVKDNISLLENILWRKWFVPVYLNYIYC
jgi:hypothetical protein